MGSIQRHFQCHFPRIVFAFLMLTASLAGYQTRAQSFGLATSNAPVIVITNTPVLYTIVVSNGIGGNLNDYEVTNVFSSNITLASFTTNNINLNQVLTTANSVLFTFTIFTNTEVDTFSFTVTTPTPGLLTNNVTVATILLTNTVSTNLVNQIITGAGDLSVSFAGPPQAVITNDISYYTINVTNLGPLAVPNVFFTNTLPPGLTLKSVVPSSPGFSLIGSNQVFSLGTLAASNGLSFQFIFQATNVITPTISASVGAAFSLDPNLTNNVVTTNFSVISYLPGQLTAVTNSGQGINFQNGLSEQTVLISNTGADVPGVRLVVTGVTGHQLYNAVGTNQVNPFVYYSTNLAAGASVVLRLQYNPRTPFPFANSQLHAFAVPTPVWPVPAFTISATNLNITRITNLFNGDKLVEFSSTLNKTYTIVYSDNLDFSNAMAAPPQVVAPANITQWIDYGPPTTISPPAAAGARFYRVYQNP